MSEIKKDLSLGNAQHELYSQRHPKWQKQPPLHFELGQEE